MRRAFLLFLLAVSTNCFADDRVPPRLRLDERAVPLAYAWRLAVDPGEPRFEAEVRITMRVQHETPVVWMNATRIDIDAAEFRQGERAIAVKTLAGGEDFVGFEAEGEPFAAGEAIATIRYHAPIDPLATPGLFRQMEGGDWYVITQFEALSARRALPCFDEPGWKTPWRLTIDAPSANQVVSNTPEQSVAAMPARAGWKRHVFAATNPLPTYLVALAIGPYDIVDGGAAGMKPTHLRYFAPKGRGAEARWAREVTPPLLAILERYFGSEYPYEKLDLVAIPQTVGFGAMENAGMITFASGLLLAKPHEESSTFRRRFASVNAHEMAHQWFGDLVTLAWWDDTWLNEAFATWMAKKTLAEYKPEWESGWAPGRARRRALEADRLASARRVHNPVVVKNDVYGAFDAITYDKGAEVLAMFEAWLGPERFRDGVRAYMKKYAWGNATSADFFRSVGVASGRADEAMATFKAFVDQTGAPLIDVTLKCASPAALEVTQQRLKPAGSGAADAQWMTPACFRYPAGGKLERQCAEIHNGAQEIALDGTKACPAWVAGNAFGAGHYVTRDDAALLKRVLRSAPQLPEQEAVAFVGDALLLAQSGLIGSGDALDAAEAFLRHRGDGVRQGAIVLLDGLRDEWLPPQLLARKRAIVARQVLPLAAGLGWRERARDRDSTTELRAQALPFAAKAEGGAKLKREAREEALKWLRLRTLVAAAMVQPVLDTAARFADRPTYDVLESLALATQVLRERSDLLKALAKVRDPELRERAFGLALRRDGGREAIDGRDALTLLEEAVDDDDNRIAAFDFIRAHYEAIVQKIPDETEVHFVGRLARGLCTAAERDQFAAFFATRAQDMRGGPRAYEQGREAIDLCVAARAAG